MSKLVSVSIDFGTTFSGYAFSYRHDPTNINTYLWSGGEAKTPTCVLFNPEGEFHSFGADAEDKYSRLTQHREDKEWYFFKHFKLLLKNEVPSSQTELRASNGKNMSALKVFSASIRFLKDHLLRQFQGQFSDRDVQWVLTVPAIWEDKARQFMRMAATEAGIPDSDLTLALEPEAASVYCKRVDTEVDTDGKYLILDCGGGTVDIAVHESCPDGRLKAVYRPTGGLWGGIKVDDAFQSFLVRCCGVDAIQEMTGYEEVQLQRSFESAKKKITSDTRDTVAVTLPMPLRNGFDVSKAGNPGVAHILGDKLRISPELMRSFFKKPLQSIVQHVKGILDEPSVGNVDTILMVGGFSQSGLLQEAVRVAFPRTEVHVVEEASSAVLRGAVICGHTPNIVGWRKSAYTYGFSVCRHFVRGYHDPRYLAIHDGIKKCTRLFDSLICIDKLIEVGNTTITRRYGAPLADLRSVELSMFRTKDRNPMYVTDPGCEKVGSLAVEMPDTTGGRNRTVQVTVSFGDAELKVEAVDGNTKVKYTAHFDFLATK